MQFATKPTNVTIIISLMMLSRAYRPTNISSHITHTEGDFKKAFIALMNGRQDKKASSTNTPDTVASEERSIHTGNCVRVAASGAPTSISIAAILRILPFAELLILHLRVVLFRLVCGRMNRINNRGKSALVVECLKASCVFGGDKVLDALRQYLVIYIDC